MTTAPDARGAFAEVLRLATLLTDRVLEAQIRDQPIPKDQVRALRKTAALLQDRGVPWPPMLKQVLHEIGQMPDETHASSVDPVDEEGASADDDLRGLSRFFAGFRKGKSGGQ